MFQLPHWVWPTALFAVCALAVSRGRDEERLAAGANLASWALTVFAYRVGYQETQWAILAFDAAQFGVLLWIAMRSRRHWPLFAAACGLLQVVTHMANAIDPIVTGWAYITAGIIWSYLILIAIGYGAWSAPDFYARMAAAGSEAGAIRR